MNGTQRDADNVTFINIFNTLKRIEMKPEVVLDQCLNLVKLYILRLRGDDTGHNRVINDIFTKSRSYYFCLNS